MKAKIHPKWNQANVVCACGNTFTVGSTVPEIRVEICAACHPFYTGQMKYIDTKGRVDAFMSKKAKADANALSKTARRAAKKAKKVADDSTRPETLSELRKMMDLE